MRTCKQTIHVTPCKTRLNTIYIVAQPTMPPTYTTKHDCPQGAQKSYEYYYHERTPSINTQESTNR